MAKTTGEFKLLTLQFFNFFIKLNESLHTKTQVRISVGCQIEPSGHGWPYSGDQGLVSIVGPTVVSSISPTLAANTGNQRCARPSAQLWPRLEPTVGPTLANCFR